MVRKAQDVYQDALALNKEEREELVRLLEMQLDNAWTPEQVETAALNEAERRHQEILNGTGQLVSGDEVMQQLRDIVAK
jgi:hypothetical protein